MDQQGGRWSIISTLKGWCRHSVGFEFKVS